MAIQPFAATGSPSITVPGTKQLIVETLSVQVNVAVGDEARSVRQL